MIFTSARRDGDDAAYDATAQRMVELASEMPGFLGIETARASDGFGITVSYWESEEAIANWKAHAAHRVAQQKGVRDWYAHYELRVARVERAYAGPRGRE